MQWGQIALRLVGLWLITPLFPLLFIKGMYALLEVDPAAGPWRVQSVESTLTSVAQPLAGNWQTVRLRDWGRPLPDRETHAWYRLQFGVPASDERDWALFVDQAYTRLHVFLNGSAVGVGGPDLGVVPVLRNPYWVALPHGLIQSNNELLIRSDSGVPFTTLDYLYVGPTDALTRAYERSFDVKRRLRDSTFFLMVGATAMFALLAYLRRGEALYSQVTLTIGSWSLCMLHRQFEQPPVTSTGGKPTAK